MNFIDYKRQLAAGTLAIVTVEVRPTAEDCDIYVFPQTWASTALGFDGLGGSAIRQANTVVVMCGRCHTAAIYFAGRHAYNVDLTDEAVRRQLDTDIQRRQIASRAEAAERYRPTSPPTTSSEESRSP